MAAGLLLLPVAIAVLAFGPWAEARITARAGAAEAARAAVVGLDLSAGGATLTELASNHGVDVDDVRLGWCGAVPGPVASASSGCSFARGSSVTAEVRIWTPLIPTPWGGVGGVWVVGSHTTPIDLYRSLG